MKRLTIILTLLCTCVFAMAQQEKLGVDLTKATIVYRTNDAPLVKQMANVLADDIERVPHSLRTALAADPLAGQRT